MKPSLKKQKGSSANMPKDTNNVSNQSERIKRNRLRTLRLKQYVLSAGGIFTFLVIFALCTFFMAQLYVISNLDNDVTELQHHYDELKGINDSKDGQIIEKLGYPQIEALAAEYGMRTPTKGQLVTEKITVQQINTSGWNRDNWIYRFFQ